MTQNFICAIYVTIPWSVCNKVTNWSKVKCNLYSSASNSAFIWKKIQWNYVWSAIFKQRFQGWCVWPCNCGLQLYIKCIQRLVETLTVVLTSIAMLVYSVKPSLFGSAVCHLLLDLIISWHHPVTHTPADIWGVFRFSDSSTNTIKSHSLHVSVSQGICRNKQKIRLQVSFSFYIKVSLKYLCMERLEGIWSVSAVSQLFSVGRCRWWR